VLTIGREDYQGHVRHAPFTLWAPMGENT